MASKRKRSLSLQRKTSKSRENKENNSPDESVKKPKLAPEDRFSTTISEEEMAQICSAYVTLNTEKNTKWSVEVFSEWRSARIKKGCDKDSATGDCPMDLLENPVISDLNFWISKFVAEVRRQDGNFNPARTIHQILAGLQRYMLLQNPDAPKIIDRKEPRFIDIHRASDNVYRSLRQKGIGTDVKHASIITKEEKLWNAKVMGVDNGKCLQHAVFYYIGKVFCIRGGEEQRKLGPSQFTRSSNPDCYTYTEHGSKNHSGGLSDLCVPNKQVPCYSIPENRPKCLVYLLDLYFSKLPEYAFVKDILYLRPKVIVPSSTSEPWYDCIPVGRNTLSSMVKEMCAEAGLEDKKTNHSLRATGTTCLFNAGVPETIIQKTTGHRSLPALRTYERVSSQQQEAVTRIMMSTDEKNTTFGEELELLSVEEDGPPKQEPHKSTAFLDSIFSSCTVSNVIVNIGKTEAPN